MLSRVNHIAAITPQGRAAVAEVDVPEGNGSGVVFDTQVGSSKRAFLARNDFVAVIMCVLV